MSQDSRLLDPLYIILVRRPDAENLMRNMVKEHRLNAQVENNRLKIFDDRSYAVFNVHWRHGWNDVVIWDVWNKRTLPIL